MRLLRISLVFLIFALAQSAWPALPPLLGQYVDSTCSIGLLDRKGEKFNEIAHAVNTLDVNSLSAAERKALFRIAVTLGEGEGLGSVIPENRFFEIIGMRLTEVSQEIWLEKQRNPQRFGRELDWAYETTMATRSFVSFDQIFQKIPLKAGETVVDIGAGFGKLGIYLGIMFPGVKFIGYELVPERVAEFNRVAKLLELDAGVQTLHQDLSDPTFRLALADYYYSWLPVDARTGQKLWQDLAEKGASHAFRYVFYGLQGGRPEPNGFRMESMTPLIFQSLKLWNPELAAQREAEAKHSSTP